MTTFNSGNKCKKNSDCSTNICEMKYENGEPQGRFCLEGAGKYSKECDFPRDCKSNECVKIFNDKGHFITKRCLRAKRPPKRESALTNLFGESPPSKFGVNNEAYLDNKIQEMGHPGPVTEIIVLVLNIIGDFFSILIYNPRVCSWDYDNQAILYGFFMSVSTGVYKALLGGYTGGLFWGGIQAKYYDAEKRQCKANSKGFDMWYVRMIITILFPPMGVFMAKGLFGMGQILLSCFLTLLFYFPGLIYSLAIISSSKTDIEESIGLKNFSK
jgi:uncharacterized membrane protein YqaE (UPF0057 family)